jgi:hypothetical protein
MIVDGESCESDRASKRLVMLFLLQFARRKS